MDLERDGRRLETRLLTQQEGEWAGYSYQWDADQQDAILVSAKGTQLELPQDRSWNIPSRAECMMCHSRAAKYTLCLTELQLNRTVLIDNQPDNQIAHWLKQELLTGARRRITPRAANARKTPCLIRMMPRWNWNRACAPTGRPTAPIATWKPVVAMPRWNSNGTAR